jgi:hypothetical protein
MIDTTFTERRFETLIFDAAAIPKDDPEAIVRAYSHIGQLWAVMKESHGSVWFDETLFALSDEASALVIIDEAGDYDLPGAARARARYEAWGAAGHWIIFGMAPPAPPAPFCLLGREEAIAPG